LFALSDFKSGGVVKPGFEIGHGWFILSAALTLALITNAIFISVIEVIEGF
jgi:hypothetical protein